MSTKHTPGPWELVLDGTHSGTWPHIGVSCEDPETKEQWFDGICECDTSHVETDNARKRGKSGTYKERPENFEPTPRCDEILANARLIAAAPELLEALMLVVRGDGTAANPIQHDIHFTAWEMTQIRAAIAKATSA